MPKLTHEDVLYIGLKLVHYTDERINRVRGDPMTSETNILRFKVHYGANHKVVHTIWEELLITDRIPEKHLLEDMRELTITSLLEAMHFLYRYKTETEREATFDLSAKTLRSSCWYYLERIQALKADKIKFPTNFKESDVWIMTVDGVHSLINEPTHVEFSQDSGYYSHKKNHAGLCYELGIHLFESKLIWMNGPFPAGPNDKANFVRQGLKNKLSSLGKKALADKIYNGYPEEISTFNAFDCDGVKELKSRAQMRHENFNGMVKEFKSMDNRFRHGEKKFKVCFEAICVICQYRMEHGEPLSDVLAGIKLN